MPFEVTNTGGETVESVQIVAELKSGDRVLESGTFVFQCDPRQGKLIGRVASYKIP